MTSQQYPTAPPAPPAGPTPLWAPLYGASFGQAVSRFFKKYADFTGRASRSEYWWTYLLTIIVVAVLEILIAVLGRLGSIPDGDGSSTPGSLSMVPAVLLIVWGLGTVVPLLAITWRRLHDANLGGPFIFLGFIPFVGSIITLVLLILPSKPEGARFDRPRA